MNAPNALQFPSDEEAVQIGYVTDFYELLRAIDEVMPNDAVLYLEGRSIAPDVAAFLEARQVADRPPVEPNSLGRKPPRVFHLALAGTAVTELRALAERHAEPEIADHLVVYHDGRVLLWAHDAGAGYVLLSRSLPGETIERFREEIPVALRQGLWERLRKALRRHR